MSKRVLFVDDQNHMRQAFESLFELNGFICFYLERTENVMAFLETEQVDLILTTLLSVTNDSFGLLTLIKEKHPNILRIALSGFTDSKQVYKAIESNLARLYLFKPWDSEEILKVIQKLFALEEQLKDEPLKQMINRIDELPTIPTLYLAVSKLIKEDAEIQRIATLIENDPAIASRILRVANSAFFGAKTGSITQAIMFIGLINVKNIILSNRVFSQIADAKQAELHWQHAGLTNRLTHIFYERVHNRKMPLVISSAGLLHNVGIVLMMSHFKQAYQPILDLMGKKPEKDLLTEEMSLLGATHAQMGSYLLDWWELPHSLVEVALYHHNPDHQNVINKDIVSFVHFASSCAWYILLDGDIAILPQESTLGPWGLNQNMLIETINQIRQETIIQKSR